jgi:hypothetical protein
LEDILDRLYCASDADYLIYTNVDIGLQPHFYSAVHALIRSGFESFVINRRTVPSHYTDVKDLEAIYAEPGIPHPGWDCFVFPRALYPRFVFHHACVGAGRVGLVLLANLTSFSSQFKEFRDEHLTFHIGDSRSWRGRDFAEYNAHNTDALMQVLADLEAEHGKFRRDSIPGKFILRRRRFGAIYDLWSQHVYLGGQLARLKNRLFRRE